MDITEIILTQHHDQRRAFALLDELRDADQDTLDAVWERLARDLEVHAVAEEELFYPRLLAVGHGGADADSADEETADALKDHNEIRDAIAETRRHAVGSEEWWQAVTDVRVANSDHMGEEERQDLADFRQHSDLQTRHDIAVAFVAHQARHPDGVVAHDKDPQAYVQDHR